MTALIDTLIDKVDNAEAVRDQIAAILLVESANQQALATAATKDPRLWALSVFVERSNPWADFMEQPTEQADIAPVVSVTFDRETFDRSGSDVVQRQKAIATFNIDCYGFGLSRGNGSGGHVAGDQEASMEAQRAMRLVRNILMSAQYTYLGMRKTVWMRFPESIQTFQISPEDRHAQQVAAARLSLTVEFSEFSPQVSGALMDTVGLTVFRAETGQIYLQSEY